MNSQLKKIAEKICEIGFLIISIKKVKFIKENKTD